MVPMVQSHNTFGTVNYTLHLHIIKKCKAFFRGQLTEDIGQ
ncbi:hypothetical protein CLCAR_2601 [Clostridium carboxidivorans P7]|nr:hypothetical protein CLCAR_2601 [Clostridium carboxidivorans P7]